MLWGKEKTHINQNVNANGYRKPGLFPDGCANGMAVSAGQNRGQLGLAAERIRG